MHLRSSCVFGGECFRGMVLGRVRDAELHLSFPREVGNNGVEG